MKNNIKKALVKFQEGLLFFSAFYAAFCFCSKLVIITVCIPILETTFPEWLRVIITILKDQL